ncbi:MAG TPA: hypothetical protein P5260_06150 [Candidatus Competibacter sp.]|nr:hypothetical protein [Candidatus Competibacter sp.]HRF61826.1 hypothetical protein [Candidatus Competibacter sp.]HRX60789.1 hypothetical protein [Candidatus Competibacter sp.]HUM91426.1 hypothetical protein [Candidatus Competibacter sp.]
MKPYLVIVEDPSSDKLLNVAIIQAEYEQEAETKAQQMFPNLPDEDLCVYDVHELNHDCPDGWTYLD